MKFFALPQCQVISIDGEIVVQSLVDLESNIRLVTLSLTIDLLKKLVYNGDEKVAYLSDHHLARIEQAHEQSKEDLRRYFRVNFSSIQR